MESQRLEMSKEKSVVIHVGRKHENSLPCPTLKVHDSDMIVEDSVKYLGNILTSKQPNFYKKRTTDYFTHRQKHYFESMAF